MFLGFDTWSYYAPGASLGIAGKPPAAIADYNNDGYQDVMTLSNQPYTLLLNLNDGSGGFPSYSALVDIIPTMCSGISFFSSVDIKNNGRPDLVMGCVNRLAFLENLGKNPSTGELEFGYLDTIRIPNIPVDCDLISEKLNGDSYMDLALLSGNSVAVILSTGPAQFEAPVYYSPCDGQVTYVAAIKNGSTGLIDLVVSYSDSRLAFLNNDGTGHFSDSCILNIQGYTEGKHLVISDFDKNAFEDIALASGDAVAVFLTKKDGNLVGPIMFTTDYDPERSAGFDQHGDGDIDIALINFGSNTVTLLRNNAR
jgi:hypothetical protein